MSPDVQVSFGLCLVFILLIPFAIAGLALINTGLGRSRSAAHAMTGAVCAIGVAFLIYCFWGFKFQGYDIPSQYVGAAYDAMSSHPGYFFLGFGAGLPSLAALFGTFAVALASLIPLGAAADRLRLKGTVIAITILAGCCYPIFARLASHLVVSMLSKGGVRFVDVGGSGTINVTGGLAALSLVWLLGPRQGKYAHKGMPAAIPAHNQVFVLFGCMLAWVGWIGLNSAGDILSGEPRLVSLAVAAATTFSAAAAALASAATTRIRFRRPDASLIANGWMAGLVASSAGCTFLHPISAIITGTGAGVLVVLSVEWFELHLKVDDPCGSISVHGVCGLWGLLVAGFFSMEQFTAQIVGIAALLGFIFPVTYGANWLLNRFIPYRVSPDGERQGLDLHELGADAYPEFVVHADEFMQR